MVLRITITDRELENKLQRLYLEMKGENWSITWNDVLSKLTEPKIEKKSR